MSVPILKNRCCGVSNSVTDLNELSEMQVKTLENRLRRTARRKDMALYKARSRIVRDYYGGYMICDFRNIVIAGGNPTAYSMRLGEVCEFLEVRA